MVSSPVACGDGSGEENLGLQTTETGFETLEKHGFNLLSNWNYCLNRKNISFMVLNKWNSVLTCFNQQTIMQHLALSNKTVESSRKNRASRWFNHQELHRTKHYADLGDNNYNLYMNNLSLATKLGYAYLYEYLNIYIYIQQQKHWLLGVYRVIGYIEWLVLAAQDVMDPGGWNLHKKVVDISWILWYPLVNIQKAIENGHRNSGFSH